MTTDTARFRAANRWKRDLLVHSSPQTTGNSEDLMLHLVVVAMLGQWPTRLPALDRGGAKVDMTGFLFAPICTGYQKDWPIVRIGKVEDVRDALRRLADYCKLSDAERVATMDALKNWIKHDARATAESKNRVDGH